MARTRARMLLLAPLLVLSGCSASFYDFNLFLPLDTVQEPDPSRYQGSDGLSNLKVDLASPAVVRALKANYALSTEILLNLQTDPNHPLGGFLHGHPTSRPRRSCTGILPSSAPMATCLRTTSLPPFSPRRRETCSPSCSPSLRARCSRIRQGPCSPT